MNKVILMGRLTRDPEVRYTQTSNTLVATFALAVNRRFVRQGEEGQQVGVIGRIQTRNWDDDKGQKHYVTEVVAEEAYFADSKREAGEGSANFENTFGAEALGGNSEFEVTANDDLPF